MTIAKLQKLQKAYEWEQTRILAWIDDLNQHSSADNDNAASPVVAEFYKIWIAYFKKIGDSNQSVIAICDEAISAGTASRVADAIDMINKEVHDVELLRPIQTAATVQKVVAEERSPKRSSSTSEYFVALDKAMQLEVTARNYIETFLTEA